MGVKNVSHLLHISIYKANISLPTSSISFLSLLLPRRNFATQIRAKQFNSGKVCPLPNGKIRGRADLAHQESSLLI